jgi:hypothetical protein
MDDATTVTALAAELGVCREMLFKWRRSYESGGAEALRSIGPPLNTSPPGGCGVCPIGCHEFRAAADPPGPGQCPLPPREAGAGLAGAPGVAASSRTSFPPTAPNLDPIERLWGLMHRNVTHSKCSERFAGFNGAMLTFPREDVPRNSGLYCDDISDNFRIISPKDFRILA